MKRDLEIYIHIPFCARKCGYCDFLSFPASEEAKERYVRALVRDILDEGTPAYAVRTVFMGGGTPSLLREGQTAEILEAVHRAFQVDRDAEVTIEANPGTLTKEKLRAYRQMGINRLSMGLQSVSDRELKLLGRIHTYQDFLDNYREARRAGFDNINVDLMSALPGQTAADWREGLRQTAALEPEHISAYSLIVEEHTPFYERYGRDRERLERGEEPVFLPGEEEERRMYADTLEILSQAGYRRYEISNYARPGRGCRHNKGYWKRTPYLGFGLGAASLLEGRRFRRVQEMGAFLGRPGAREEETALSRQEEMEETLFLGLRLTEGVSEEEFFRLFGEPLDKVYEKPLEDMLRAGLLERREGWVRLTRRGIDVSNYVMAQFLL